MVANLRISKDHGRLNFRVHLVFLIASGIL